MASTTSPASPTKPLLHRERRSSTPFNGSVIRYIEPAYEKSVGNFPTTIVFLLRTHMVFRKKQVSVSRGNVPEIDTLECCSFWGTPFCFFLSSFEVSAHSSTCAVYPSSHRRVLLPTTPPAVLFLRSLCENSSAALSSLFVTRTSAFHHAREKDASLTRGERP